MRFAFRRRQKVAESVEAPPASERRAFGLRDSQSVAAESTTFSEALLDGTCGNLDLRIVGRALWRRKRWIIIPTALAATLSILVVNFVAPHYESEARILIAGRENIFLRSLENDARISGARVEGLTAGLENMKRQATSINGQDVELRALERGAKSQRDLLKLYLAKYREATARKTIDNAPIDERITSRAVVTNTPEFPKKFPIILIATLSTLMFSVGMIVSGELLRMMAPRTSAGVGVPRVSRAAALDSSLPIAAADMWRHSYLKPQTRTLVGDIEKLVRDLLTSGRGARKITVFGVGQDEGVAMTALTLARLLVRQARVVLVQLSISPQTLGATSSDSTAFGLSDLMLGDATFGQIITKDRLSQLHLVAAGRALRDRSILQSSRLSLAIGALLQVYDYVVLDAGTAADFPASLLSSNAQAVVMPEPVMNEEARSLMCDRLRVAGFIGVTMLNNQAGFFGMDVRHTVGAAA